MNQKQREYRFFRWPNIALVSLYITDIRNGDRIADQNGAWAQDSQLPRSQVLVAVDKSLLSLDIKLGLG
jgi:hypothetical protein